MPMADLRPAPDQVDCAAFELARLSASGGRETTLAVYQRSGAWYLWGGAELTPAQAAQAGWTIAEAFPGEAQE
jgi:hypothetical protein